MSPSPPGPVLRRLLRAPAALYDWRLGWLLGHRFLRLTHAGRRSGRHFHTMLEVLRWDGVTHEVVVMAGLGRRADWLRNVEAGGAVEVAISRERFTPDHRILPVDEAAAVLADYERRNRLLAPVLRKALGWLVGWPYNGSDEARRRLVEQLALVAFEPVRT
jgi:deazaflavin-dependent oxidoreductase (nitroreductase family)